MKKRIIALLIGLVVGNNLVFSQQDSIHIGFILSDLYSARWYNDMRFFKERALEKGVKVTFIDCYDQIEKQKEAAIKLANIGVDCIVLVPIDSHDKQVVSIAKNANIPVVTYDRFLFDSDVKLCISFNSVKVGEMMAEQVMSKLESGEIFFLGGPKSDFNSTLVRKGVVSSLKDKRNNYKLSIKHATDWSEISAFIEVQNYFDEKGSFPDAIICASDDLTKGALLAVEEKGYLGKVLLTGQDATIEVCKSILKDDVLMTVYKSNKKLAYASVDAILNMLKGNILEFNEEANTQFMQVPAIFEEPELITKENLVEVLVSKGIYSEKSLKE